MRRGSWKPLSGPFTPKGSRRKRYLIPEVGTLHFAHRSARKGRNHATGEEIQIAARRVVTFKATKTLQDRVNS
ncbi:HU family DNA-binding protein [Acidithiobacillus ferriphilus]|uniref:HU family DNA-binding protein n=1 Tax=Acidithiobacillus ferriphilus TaxID=1689834 RepID=UPI001C07BFA7|nr:hypothetical protein [Acidithiobacillus ferriphilus]